MSRTHRTALVVDDDAFVVSALAEMLSEEGYDVHTATNGFSAMRQAVDYQPSVILLDLRLPERSGRDVLNELRGDPATRDVAIVVVTGHPDELTEADLADADGLVAKPFDIDHLLEAVRRAIQHASSRRAEVPRVSSIGHPDEPARVRRASSARHTSGRR